MILVTGMGVYLGQTIFWGQNRDGKKKRDVSGWGRLDVKVCPVEEVDI